MPLIIDDLEIHREAVSIPLAFEGAGEVRQPTPETLVIVGPEGDPTAFLDGLLEILEALDLSRVPRI